MKKKRLKLVNLKVQSFVTAMNETETHTIRGGDAVTNPAACTQVPACQNSVAFVCPSVGRPCYPPFTLNVECL